MKILLLISLQKVIRTRMKKKKILFLISMKKRKIIIGLFWWQATLMTKKTILLHLTRKSMTKWPLIEHLNTRTRKKKSLSMKKRKIIRALFRWQATLMAKKTILLHLTRKSVKWPLIQHLKTRMRKK